MAIQTKDQYISPKCEVLEMNTEGVIATSVPGWDNGGPLFS